MWCAPHMLSSRYPHAMYAMEHDLRDTTLSVRFQHRPNDPRPEHEYLQRQHALHFEPHASSRDGTSHDAPTGLRCFALRGVHQAQAFWSLRCWFELEYPSSASVLCEALQRLHLSYRSRYLGAQFAVWHVHFALDARSRFLKSERSSVSHQGTHEPWCHQTIYLRNHRARHTKPMSDPW